MATLDDALQTQIRNIEQSTGRSMAEWTELVKASGKTKHGEVLAWLKSEHGMSHGNANRVALTALRGPAAPEGDALSTPSMPARRRPSGPSTIRSSRSPRGSATTSSSRPSRPTWRCADRSSSATVGPASGGRLEIGLNLKGVEPNGRLEASTGMCTHRVRLSGPQELDDEVRGWLREAYERA